jgi:predicted nucleotidyltransferase/cell fate (sporulation/competence/biofilm development) regulator YlbF (YheA/YmcA/DUF963 family)
MQGELNKQFFNNELQLNPKIRVILLKMAHEIVASASEALEKKIPVSGTIFTGSLCSVNWDEYSDIDLHILIDYSGLDEEKKVLLSEFLNYFIKDWNKNEFTVLGFKVEAYPQDKDETHQAEGIFDLENNEWIKQPDLNNKLEYTPEQAAKAKEYYNRVKELRCECNNPKQAEQFYDEVKALWSEIKEMRQKGMDSAEGMFSDENRVFKLLRRNKTLATLVELMRRTKKKIFTIPENKTLPNFKNYLKMF